MNIYENYIETLLEDKPIGDKNKELWLEYLKKNYTKEDKDIFVTFVSEDKVGINPKSDYNTPNGVYVYPVTWLLAGHTVPFRGKSKPKKIKILKLISDKVLDKGLSNKQYNDSVVKFIEKYKDRFTKDPIESMHDFEDNHDEESNFKKVWVLTYNKSTTPNDWTKMLITIGFDFVYDNGQGVIHSNEPTQAVFLNPKSYKVVGEEFVDTTERYFSNNKKLSFADIKSQLDGTPANIYQFLITHKQKIYDIIDSSNDLPFVLKITYVVYNKKNDFNRKEREKLLSLYGGLISSILKRTNYKYINNLAYLTNESELLEYLNCFELHDAYVKVVSKYLEKGDIDLFDKIPQKIIAEHFLTSIYNFIKNGNLSIFEWFDKNVITLIYKDLKEDIDKIYKEDKLYIPSKLLNVIKENK